MARMESHMQINVLQNVLMSPILCLERVLVRILIVELEDFFGFSVN